MIKFQTLQEAEAYNEQICADMRIRTNDAFISPRWSEVTEKEGAFHMEEHPDYPHSGEVVEVITENNEEIV